MTPADLDALLLTRRTALAKAAAQQLTEIKAAKCGPWAPALVAVKPRATPRARSFRNVPRILKAVVSR